MADHSRILERLADLPFDGKLHIVCGDYNIAHREIDTYDPVRNASMTGFLPHERAWMDSVVDEVGMVDAFRLVDPVAEALHVVSNFAGAFEKNLGWRIDYQLVTPNVAPFVRSASIYKDECFSDHAPVTIAYDIEFPSAWSAFLVACGRECSFEAFHRFEPGTECPRLLVHFAQFRVRDDRAQRIFRERN